MRLVPLLMLALLLVGFASRPTVSAALTDGHVLLHPFASVLVADIAPSVDDASDDPHTLTITKCVSLGVLPCASVLAEPQKDQTATRLTSHAGPAKPVYDILRPPISAARASTLLS